MSRLSPFSLIELPSVVMLVSQTRSGMCVASSSITRTGPLRARSRPVDHVDLLLEARLLLAEGRDLVELRLELLDVRLHLADAVLRVADAVRHVRVREADAGGGDQHHEHELHALLAQVGLAPRFSNRK